VESLEKVLSCDCGFEVRAEHEDRLVAEVQQHAWEVHGMQLSPDQALQLASRAEVDASVPSRKSAREAANEASRDRISDREEEK